MLRTLTLLCCVFLVFCNGWGQDTAKPAERLALDACPEGEPSCVYETLRSRMQPILEKHSALLADSTHLWFKFRIDSTGQLLRLQMSLRGQTRNAYDSIRPEVERSLEGLAPIRVVHPEQGPYPSWHSFTFDYLRGADSLWIPEKSERIYAGGVVEKPPVFEHCIRSGFEPDIRCFQDGIRAHIVQNFRYPKEALSMGIEGNVYVRFTIDPKGRVTDLRAERGDPSLQAEALRMMAKLPPFHPGERDGQADAYEFTIPVAFRLSK